MALTDTSTAAPSPDGTSRARHLLLHNRGDQVRLSTDQHGRTFAAAVAADTSQPRQDCYFCKDQIAFKNGKHLHVACKTAYHRQCFQQVCPQIMAPCAHSLTSLSQLGRCIACEPSEAQSPLSPKRSPLKDFWKRQRSPVKHKNVVPRVMPRSPRSRSNSSYLGLQLAMISSTSVLPLEACTLDVEVAIKAHCVKQRARADRLPITAYVIWDTALTSSSERALFLQTMRSLADCMVPQDRLTVFSPAVRVSKGHCLVHNATISSGDVAVKLGTGLRSMVTMTPSTERRHRALLKIFNDILSSTEKQKQSHHETLILFFGTGVDLNQMDIIATIRQRDRRFSIDCFVISPVHDLIALQAIAHSSGRGVVLQDLSRESLANYLDSISSGRPAPVREVRLEFCFAPGIELVRPTPSAAASQNEETRLVVIVSRLGLFEHSSTFVRLQLPAEGGDIKDGSQQSSDPSSWRIEHLERMLNTSSTHILTCEVSYKHELVQDGAQIKLPASNLELRRTAHFLPTVDIDMSARCLISFALRAISEHKRHSSHKQESLDALVEAEHELKAFQSVSKPNDVSVSTVLAFLAETTRDCGLYTEPQTLLPGQTRRQPLRLITESVAEVSTIEVPASTGSTPRTNLYLHDDSATSSHYSPAAPIRPRTAVLSADSSTSAGSELPLPRAVPVLASGTISTLTGRQSRPGTQDYDPAHDLWCQLDAQRGGPGPKSWDTNDSLHLKRLTGVSGNSTPLETPSAPTPTATDAGLPVITLTESPTPQSKQDRMYSFTTGNETIDSLSPPSDVWTVKSGRTPHPKERLSPEPRVPARLPQCPAVISPLAKLVAEAEAAMKPSPLSTVCGTPPLVFGSVPELRPRQAKQQRASAAHSKQKKQLTVSTTEVSDAADAGADNTTGHDVFHDCDDAESASEYSAVPSTTLLTRRHTLFASFGRRGESQQRLSGIDAIDEEPNAAYTTSEDVHYPSPARYAVLTQLAPSAGGVFDDGREMTGHGHKSQRATVLSRASSSASLRSMRSHRSGDAKHSLRLRARQSSDAINLLRSFWPATASATTNANVTAGEVKAGMPLPRPRR